MNVYKACWITCEKQSDFDLFAQYRMHHIAKDKDGNMVFLAESSWMLNTMIKDFPGLNFHFNSEFKTDLNRGN
jgi:peptide chain release factor 3